jgi:monooxygenase
MKCSILLLTDPGLRSDSDMLTFGYSFYHWNRAETLAGKKNILGYLNEVVTKFDLNKRIQFNTNVNSASWDSDEAKWTVTTNQGVYKTKFLFMCGGYYSYDKGYNPDFPGKDTFKGQILHPQNWDTSVDVKGKKIVVIGSGATAITLVPELVKMGADHVVMVQRSPSFILDVPGQDWANVLMRMVLPARVVTTIGRWVSIAVQVGMYNFCRTFPWLARKLINLNVRWHTGGKVDMKHFTPKYNPWDQRLVMI